ncbi:hypothetical protein H6G80_27355 [Nostoc sp. FACHB-87]|uniref:hypothetical protein n=1 Tax=Nostocaceae TaxID=1162 RepID=UPI001688B7DF|nr:MULTISPECIES: hypothetical protein [Nostocaceae]MBD2457773.1 hypothetical protein [Nostoc sp. FACHB-87]MBD2478234.1 hypothetical protein [Anabaena sp. FACHB-83]
MRYLAFNSTTSKWEEYQKVRTDTFIEALPPGEEPEGVDIDTTRTLSFYSPDGFMYSLTPGFIDEQNQLVYDRWERWEIGEVVYFYLGELPASVTPNFTHPDPERRDIDITGLV